MKCPLLENLIAYAEAPDDAAISAHLTSGCSRCVADVEWYRRLLILAASDDTVEPPPWVLKRALRLFETQMVETPGVPSKVVERLGHLIAALVFDSATRPVAAAGARRVGSEDRQLLYQAGAYDIDLQIAAGDETGVILSGQILRHGEFEFESVSGLALHLVLEGRQIGSTMTNRFGEFFLPVPERGRYDLQIETNEISITVVGLPGA